MLNYQRYLILSVNFILWEASLKLWSALCHGRGLAVTEPQVCLKDITMSGLLQSDTPVGSGGTHLRIFVSETEKVICYRLWTRCQNAISLVTRSKSLVKSCWGCLCEVLGWINNWSGSWCRGLHWFFFFSSCFPVSLIPYIQFFFCSLRFEWWIATY